MYTINDDIKSGKLRNVYLLCGAEHYLVVSYRRKLLHAFCGTSERSALCEDMNYTAFKGNEVRTEEIIGVAETLPFFAERRVILVEDTGLFAKEGDSLAEYLTEMPPTTVMWKRIRIREAAFIKRLRSRGTWRIVKHRQKKP